MSEQYNSDSIEVLSGLDPVPNKCNCDKSPIFDEKFTSQNSVKKFDRAL